MVVPLLRSGFRMVVFSVVIMIIVLFFSKGIMGEKELSWKGIGGLLIAKGLQLLRERGTELVFVLGHKEYYPRHGFVPDAGKQGFQAPYPIPDELAECWMVQALSVRGTRVPKGRILCADTLFRPEHWRE